MIDEIICGSTLDVLKDMEAESIDCCICSPPYWGLRDYGIDGQLGLEPTFQLYIKHLLEIFDEVYRVLKKTGTCWVNIGDTYGGTGDKGNWRDPKYKEGRNGQAVAINKNAPAKSLCNIPFRFAIGMTDHGWIQRNTIIWHKPSCMPSSAKDRFTVDFEYVFFFVKQKSYWFEQQFEAPVSKPVGTPQRDTRETHGVGGGNAGLNSAKAKAIALGTYQHRNRRAVWRINPQPFKDAHFAVFPEKLVEPMILAGCPREICDSCGYAFNNETKREYITKREIVDLDNTKRARMNDKDQRRLRKNIAPDYTEKHIKQTKKCNCNAPTHPGIVLDPFVGSGTTCLVARKLGRHYIGIDLNEDYCDMARKRIAEVL